MAFYSRRFSFSKQMEAYINFNKILQNQIVSISNTAVANNEGQVKMSNAFLYFFSDTPLLYDLFEELTKEQQEKLQKIGIEAEAENAKQKRLTALREAYAYHTDPENYSVKAPEKHHKQEAIKIDQELKDNDDGAIYTKVIGIDNRYIVPIDCDKYAGKDFYDLIVSLNPKVKIETKWIYLK